MSHCVLKRTTAVFPFHGEAIFDVANILKI